MKALALAELVFYLPGALFSLLKAAHRIGLLTVPEVDVAQVEVCAVEVFQHLTFSLRQKNKTKKKTIVILTIFLWMLLHRGEVTFGTSLLCNKDTSANKFAATFGLPEMVTDQTQIEKETCLHLANLSCRHSSCR